MALKALTINFGTLVSCVNFHFLYGPKAIVDRNLGFAVLQQILSLIPLSIEEQRSYSLAPASNARFQMNIDVYNSEGKLLCNVGSARDLAKG
jgi:hypothetical protein